MTSGDLGSDLEAGRELQRHLLPRPLADLGDWDLAGDCVQAGAVGGDLFDWQRLGEKVQVVVADVMGKGLPAAMLSTVVRAMIRGASPYHNPADVLRRVAVDLADDLTEVGRFITVFAMRFQPGSDTVEYVDAGHGMAFVVSPGRGGRRLASEGLPVGTLPDDSWRMHSTTVHPGDAVVAISDGLHDAVGGLEPVIATADEELASGADAASLVATLTRLAREADSDIVDDVTVVVARRLAG
ncbi:PP2C family protein-serine/threonine phosphatase [Nocardioides cheoyonin]|uniref:PP2C family protein-serine/threonine phosphatase n=1 Tax=Nocardioides cheoyonin TaxID=3156615 RepID=UPI0032B5FFB6